jgi:hypothetical protein
MSLEQKQILDGSWYKESPESGKIGIDLQGAKDLLKKRKMKKVPVVALIGTGADIEHEALKNSVWVNPKEKADGKDNDNNGYADDINGWNFIGSKDGSSMEFGIQEANREWLRLKDKYADILFDGKRYFKYENGVRVYIAAPEDIEEFNYFTKIIRERDGSLSGLYGGYIIAFLVKEYTQEWDKEIQLKFPGKTRKEITSDEFFAAVYDKNGPQDSLKNIALTLVSLYSSFGKTMRNNPNYVTTWSDIYENFTDIVLSSNRYIKTFIEYYDVCMTEHINKVNKRPSIFKIFARSKLDKSVKSIVVSPKEDEFNALIKNIEKDNGDFSAYSFNSLWQYCQYIRFMEKCFFYKNDPENELYVDSDIDDMNMRSFKIKGDSFDILFKLTKEKDIATNEPIKILQLKVQRNYGRKLLNQFNIVNEDIKLNDISDKYLIESIEKMIIRNIVDGYKSISEINLNQTPYYKELNEFRRWLNEPIINE